MNFKKLTLITIALCFVFMSLTGCGCSNHEHDDDVTEASSETTIETVETIETTEPTESTINTNNNNNNNVNTESKPTENNSSNDESHSGSNSDAVNPNYLGEFRLTAYCKCTACCGQWAGGATASGVMPVANHTIAVDTSVIPFGTKVVINGNTYVSEDTGSAIKGNRIDIYFDTHQEALNFGVQYADVYKVVD